MSELRISEVRTESEDMWKTSDIKNGLTLGGNGGLTSEPGQHRSYSYAVKSYQSPTETGYRTIQSSDIVHDPILKRDQLVTITASHLRFYNNVDEIQNKIRKLEQEVHSLPYNCRVLQNGASVEVQCYFSCGVTNNEKCLAEEKILNIIKQLQ